MDTLTLVRCRIIELCAQRGFTVNGLAEHAGLSASTLKNILYGKSKNPGILTLKIICDGLDITLSAFFDTPAFHALEQEIQKRAYASTRMIWIVFRLCA